MQTGVDRFLADQRNTVDLRTHYTPWPIQERAHRCTAPNIFLGGAAGPGKTTWMLMENLHEVNSFGGDNAKQVHTLMLRRTQPKVRNTLVTRFREKIPKELYRSFNETSLECEWLNGATTKFGSMQYEANVYDWQGQWKDIYFDEQCEFTFKQYNDIAPWNRCPVSKYARRIGAGNPVGVGAPWNRALFVDHKPCDEMDASQRAQYRAEDYAYFPCTYLDNPIFANDPKFIAGLMALPEALRKALMEGSWDVTGGYFVGAYDAAECVYPAHEFDPKPWHRQWISGDWGFEHWSALYRHYMDDAGIIRTGRELMLQHHDPEMLAERIVAWLTDETGRTPRLEAFPFSHDAFASNTTKSYGAEPNSVATRMARALAPFSVPTPTNSGRDKVGREQTMYNMLRTRKWLVGDDCPKLMQCLASAPRDEEKVEQIADFLGDDPLQGAGYGLYWALGNPAKKPHDELMREKLAATSDPTQRHFIRLQETERRKQASKPLAYWE